MNKVDHSFDLMKALSKENEYNGPTAETVIVEVIFTESTRNLLVKFKEIKGKRTIKKTFTHEGKKFKIYNPWVYSEKEIVKQLKLSNNVLNNLNSNPNALIREHAYEIVGQLPDEYHPEWFQVKTNTIKKQQLISERNSQIREISRMQDEIRSLDSFIEQYQQEISSNDSNIRNLKKENKTIAKKRKNIAIQILTLGIYSLILNGKEKSNNYLIYYYTEENKAKENNIYISERKIADYKIAIENLSESKKECDSLIADLENVEIKPLKEEMVTTKIRPENKDYLNQPAYSMDNFVSLKEVQKMNKRLIIGCYIIRNVENGMVYVGQSKDIMRRLSQHFNGTIPKNELFIPDYEKARDKENLFMVRIVETEEKAVLDEVERDLIKHYNSFKRGYNRTSGNI